MDWKLILGDAYEEGLTDEEYQEQFRNMYVPKATVDKTVRDMKKVQDDLAAENADWKKKFRATQSEAEQKAQEEAEEKARVQQELKDLRRENQITKLEKKYMDMGYTAEKASEAASAFYDGDTDALFSIQKRVMEEKEKAIRAEAMKAMPKPPAGNGNQVEYDAKLEEARKAGDDLAMASLILQQFEAGKEE